MKYDISHLSIPIRLSQEVLRLRAFELALMPRLGCVCEIRRDPLLIWH
jgi:hypothetical protein